MPRNYKPVPKCPPELQEIFNAVNLRSKMSKKLIRKLLDFSKKVRQASFEEREAILAEFEGLKSEIEEDLLDYLVGKKLDKEKPYSLINLGEISKKLVELLTAKKVLRYIAEKNNNPEVFGVDLLKMYYRTALKTGEPFFKGTFSYNDGNFKIHTPPLFEILTNPCFSLSRITVCPICQDIYWTKKTKTKTCGKKKCIDNFQNLKKKEAKKSKEQK